MEWQRRNSECDVLDRMLVEKNFRMRGTSGWNGGERNSECNVSGWNGGGGILDAICPGGMAAGGIPDVICPDGMNVIMSSMKDGYGLYGYGGLGKWL